MNDDASRITPLGVMVLALLREGDMHPYEMMRLMKQRHDDRMVQLAGGTFYHTVARLERAGLLAEVGVDRDGNRPERRTYSLTAAGREVVPEWVRRELVRIDRPMEFRIALAEAHNLSRETTLALLAERRSALAADLETHRSGADKAHAKGVPAQFLVEVDRQKCMLAADLAWLDGFVERWSDPSLSWGVDELRPQTIETLISYRQAATS